MNLATGKISAFFSWTALGVFYESDNANAENCAQIKMPACTLQNLRVYGPTTAAAIAGHVAVRVNGAESTLKVDIPKNTTQDPAKTLVIFEDTKHPLQINNGDLVCLRAYMDDLKTGMNFHHFSFEIWPPGQGSSTTTIQPPPDKNHKITVTVYDLTPVIPALLPGVAVKVTSAASDGQVGQATTASNGKAVISDIVDGTYNVECTKSSYNNNGATVQVAGADVDVTINMRQGAGGNNVMAYVYDYSKGLTDPTGAIAGATVYMKDPSGKITTLFTNSNGTADFLNLANGNYDAWTLKDGWTGDHNSANFDLPGTTIINLGLIHVTGRHLLKVHVYDIASQQPTDLAHGIASANVTVKNDSTGSVDFGPADSAGCISFLLDDGYYHVTASADGYNSVTVPVHMVDDFLLPIGLTSTGGTLTVHLLNALTGAPIAGGTAAIPPYQSNFKSTDSTGTAVFTGLSPGSYAVMASAGDYYTNTQTTLVSAIGTSITIRLQPISAQVQITLVVNPFNAGTAQADNNSTTTQRTDSYTLGSYVVFEVTATAPGYTFDHWTYGGTANPTSVQIVSSGTITAYFKRSNI